MIQGQDPRMIGRVVKIRGFQVKVSLLEDHHSPTRGTPDGVRTAIAVNSYVTLSIDLNRIIVGVITELETTDTPPASTKNEQRFSQPRSIATVQLLGTLQHDEFDATEFYPAITVLPTLDTPAMISSPELLDSIFATPPKRNRPRDSQLDAEYDHALPMGMINMTVPITAKGSFNDLFSRPLAILGNTGSGKSFTIASLIQSAEQILEDIASETHIFILDINGEYASAFSETDNVNGLDPDMVYLDGKKFGIPVWLFNASELCSWLSASEQTQEPLLKDWWSIAKGDIQQPDARFGHLNDALKVVDGFLADCITMKKKEVGSRVKAIQGHLTGSDLDLSTLVECTRDHMKWDKFNTEIIPNQREVMDSLRDLRLEISKRIGALQDDSHFNPEVADAPLYVSRSRLATPSLTDNVVSQEDTPQIEQHLTTLRVRLAARLSDRRWSTFLNYEDAETRIRDIGEWFRRLGVGDNAHKTVSVLDLSMLSHEVLPYACAVVGRVLLEARERLEASERYRFPWVLVLEEAHNYVGNRHSDEEKGQMLSRTTYERIAKEGRKFGMSLVVASQRPSEVSPTILSQCANFLCHRLQNPEDIDHIRRIVPVQAVGLLSQITTLDAGEVIAFGSAFQVPSRARINLPDRTPSSHSAAPYLEWKSRDSRFPAERIAQSYSSVTLPTNQEKHKAHRPNCDDVSTNNGLEGSDSKHPSEDQEDDIPF